MSEVAEAPESVRIAPQPDMAALIEAATKRVLAELAAAPRSQPKNCGSCRHWTRLHMMKTHGQCMLSGKSTMSPALTTDLARCSGWQDL